MAAAGTHGVLRRMEDAPPQWCLGFSLLDFETTRVLEVCGQGAAEPWLALCSSAEWTVVFPGTGGLFFQGEVAPIQHGDKRATTPDWFRPGLALEWSLN